MTTRSLLDGLTTGPASAAASRSSATVKLMKPGPVTSQRVATSSISVASMTRCAKRRGFSPIRLAAAMAPLAW